MTSINELMGPRTSANLTPARLTPNTSFGARVRTDASAASAVAGGLGLAPSMVPGGAIVSAAVSSLSTLPSGLPGAPASGGPQYLGGTTSNTGGEFNGEMAAMFQQQRDLLRAQPSAGSFDGDLANMFQQQKSLLTLQAQMQNESQKYTAISNVMKTRHETCKNAIGNIR